MDHIPLSAHYLPPWLPPRFPVFEIDANPALWGWGYTGEYEREDPSNPLSARTPSFPWGDEVSILPVRLCNG